MADAFNAQCLPPASPDFGEKDYWVAVLKGSKLDFPRLVREEDQKNIKDIFSNLQGAATQSRAGGLLDTPSRANLWESNIISRFQKGKRR